MGRMKMRLFYCRDCGDEIFHKRFKRGFADQCDICSEETEEPPRHLGFNDGSLNKASHTSIYRGDSDAIRSKIKNQKARVH